MKTMKKRKLSKGKIILVFFSVISTFGFSQKPDWMKPHPEGRSVFVQGLLVDKADSLKVLSGSVLITNVENSNESYLLQTNRTGIFQFHLWENSRYTAAFSCDGYVSRKIEFDTHDVPNKAWKSGCNIELKMSLDLKPQGFKELVAVLPFATFKYDIDERIFLFDVSRTDAIIQRYEEELERARAAEKPQVEPNGPQD